MELEDSHQLHLHSCKRSRVGNDGKTTKMRRKDSRDKEDGGEVGKATNSGKRMLSWQHIPSSRIYRVSRASGGKDRHSKVYTSKGLRDRRVRLSVATAIQFYDLQDRLGYDQPSKAIEWLIKAAESSIKELPSLDCFMQTFADENTMVAEPGADFSYNFEQKQYKSSKSRCTSPSDTSKGSVLSLSRSDCRIKAEDHAQEQAVKNNNINYSRRVNAGSPNLNSHTSFTELLTGNPDRHAPAAATAIATTGAKSSSNDIQKQMLTGDYFSEAGIFLQSQKNQQQLALGFSSHSHFGNSSSAMAMMPFNIAAGEHSELQQFSILQDNIMPVSAVPSTAIGDCNLNFSIASGFAGFNRGTLQSNSPCQLPHNHNHTHRLSLVDGANLPFFFGAALTSAAPTTVDHQFPPDFDGCLQLCYGDGFRQSDLKGKGKN